jgi:signal transduction histidine kinase
VEPRREGARPPRLAIFLALAFAAIVALGVWDEQRESTAALDDFAREQATLAGTVASLLSSRIAAAREGGGPVAPAAKLLGGATPIERPGAVRLLVQGPEGDFQGTDGRAVACEPIRRALAAGQTSVWLSRPEAAALGLPLRRAAAGLAMIDAGSLGRFSIAVVSSAERVRDRERRARLRLGLGVLLAGGLVGAFGSVALRKQRRGLLLERELALGALERERAEQLAAASRAAMMGTLAMGIAHEVSTPLGIIAGRAEQLAPRVAGDERATRAVEAVIEQAERIRRVIRGFLDLVRGEARELLDAAPAAVLEGAVFLVEHRFAAAGVILSTDVPADLPVIRGDVPMLQQALVNLLLNACDACAHGGRVEARVRREGDRVTFTVSDDGVGITAEQAARATEPFFTTKAPGHGTGLGLAIANEIVKMHRGALSVRPASPRGTVASLTLPAAEEAHAAA